MFGKNLWVYFFSLSLEVDSQNRKNEELSLQQKLKLPDGVIDFDAETENDPFQVGLYAEDIFAYYRRREGRFNVKKYLDKQLELNRNMRSILSDWMVEVQVGKIQTIITLLI
jgi:hypothetical protein